MRRDLKRALAASIAMNLALPFLFRGSFLQALLIVYGLGIMVICFGIAVIMFAIGRFSPARRRSTVGVVLAGLVAGSAFFSLPIGAYLNEYDIDQARAFCESLRPAIEQSKADTGRYPERPPGIASGTALPRLLSGSNFYQAKEDCYRFYFPDPSRIFTDFVYDSVYRQWHEED